MFCVHVLTWPPLPVTLRFQAQYRQLKTLSTGHGLKVRRSHIHGWGLFACEEFQKGACLVGGRGSSFIYFDWIIFQISGTVFRAFSPLAMGFLWGFSLLWMGNVYIYFREAKRPPRLVCPPPPPLALLF